MNGVGILIEGQDGPAAAPCWSRERPDLFLVAILTVALPQQAAFQQRNVMSRPIELLQRSAFHHRNAERSNKGKRENAA